MNYNFTDRVRKVLALAREEAIRLQHDYVGTEHLLLGVIREGQGVSAAVLSNLSVDFEELEERIEEAVRRGTATISHGELPYTSRAKKVLEFAMAESRELGHSYVGTEHLLLGLLREEKGIAAEVLNQFGVTLDKSRRQTLKLLGAEPNTTEAASAKPWTGPKATAGPRGGDEDEALIRLNGRIAEAFSRHKFAVAADYFAEDIEWDMVGEGLVRGREAVVAQCMETERYLATVSTIFTSFRVMPGNGWVVVDSTAEYRGEGVDLSVVASCDIYRFTGHRIAAIRSYNIEIGQS